MMYLMYTSFFGMLSHLKKDMKIFDSEKSEIWNSFSPKYSDLLTALIWLYVRMFIDYVLTEIGVSVQG